MMEVKRSSKVKCMSFATTFYDGFDFFAMSQFCECF